MSSSQDTLSMPVTLGNVPLAPLCYATDVASTLDEAAAVPQAFENHISPYCDLVTLAAYNHFVHR